MFTTVPGRLVAPLIFALLASAAPADIYRCDGPEGPVFRDLPCRADQRPEHIVPQVAEGAGLRASERQWLKRRMAEGRRKGPAKVASTRRRDDKAQARRCLAKRQRLENVRARLRRGYKPPLGDRLRRLRRQYEDYLSRFCD